MKIPPLSATSLPLILSFLMLTEARTEPGGVNSLHPALPAAPNDSDYYDNGKADPEKFELGRLLFFDKILSGNRNISCATCHHPEFGTSDGVSLSFGEGAVGLGPERRAGSTITTAVHGRVPRNSPALFNLGAREFVRLFHDGRVETDPEHHYEGGFITPAKWKLPKGLDSVLAAQAMFPVASPEEMSGQKGENPVANAVSLNNAAGPGGVWELLGKRLRAIPEYQNLFRKAFPGKIRSEEDITYIHAANAIAAFEAVAFRADRSPFDQYLRGEKEAMNPEAVRGMHLFYGKARCAVCHSGTFQTDHQFHAIAMPQIGPGKADGRDDSYWRASGHRGFLEDYGRGRVTVRDQDNFKFRTPSLRNTAVTGPWGHAGAYRTLKEVVRHHCDPETNLVQYLPGDDLLPPMNNVLELTMLGSSADHEWIHASRLQDYLSRDTWVARQPKLLRQIASANELEPMPLTENEISDLVAFLNALTDPDSVAPKELVPQRVPSGLPVVD